LRVELTVGGSPAPGRLRRCGLIVINPPWTLERDLSILLPALTVGLSLGRSGTFRIDRLGRER
jgi:23S rRNA (adenine2030-N6)-methyltransferase